MEKDVGERDITKEYVTAAEKQSTFQAACRYVPTTAISQLKYNK